MDFDYSEEQTLFSDSLRKLLEDTYSDTERRKVLDQDDSFHSEALWQAYAELGLLGLTFPEEMGGFGGSAIDMMVAEIEFGRFLSLEPYLASAILGGDGTSPHLPLRAPNPEADYIPEPRGEARAPIAHSLRAEKPRDNRPRTARGLGGRPRTCD